jgi:hypothetical protein
VATDDVIERLAEALRVVVTGEPDQRASVDVEEQQGRCKLDALVQGEMLDPGRLTGEVRQIGVVEDLEPDGIEVRLNPGRENRVG